MGQTKTPLPVKLFIGVLAVNEKICQDFESDLIEKFGPIDYSSPLIPFNITSYYVKEMGPVILRRFYSFKNLIDPGELADIKLWTNELELRSGSNRKINLDPGYLTGAKVILATTKNYAHRIYIGKGIYAEVTLRYKGKSFLPFDYTYPDYATQEYFNTFEQIRNLYMEQILPILKNNQLT